MAGIEWKPEYSVGDPAIDQEHRELVDLVNRTAVAILERHPDGDVQRAFGDLIRAVSAHFALEERQMRETGYDQLRPHKDDHERLIDVLRDLMDEPREGEDVAEVLTRELEEWFAGHFREHDSRLHMKLGPH